MAETHFYPTPMDIDNNMNGSTKHKNGKMDKTKEKLITVIIKTQTLRDKTQREVSFLDEQINSLQQLLSKADDMDHNDLKNEIKRITDSFKERKKQANDLAKLQKKIIREECKLQKEDKKVEKLKKKIIREERKIQQKESKNLIKLQKKVEREERKIQKEERKKLKKLKAEQLENARCASLPASKDEIGGHGLLYVYVDGYNLIGCDKLCRQSMRGKGGSMKKAQMRMAELLQKKLISFDFDYNLSVKLWFDGNGKNRKIEDVQIEFSTKEQTVDDRLVEMFGKNDKSENANYLVITSDRELTLRLNDVGVKVMKSSVFYRTYLKEKNDKNMDEDLDDVDSSLSDSESDDNEGVVDASVVATNNENE